jgi:release factor glutamine methyltransferase
VTVAQAINQAKAAFAGLCVDANAAGLDARLLAAKALGWSVERLLAHSDAPLEGAALAAFNAFVERRLSGECAAYIIGTKDFRYLTLAVNESVLVPRPETELLVEAALRLCGGGNARGGERGGERGDGKRVLDICTGSGAVALALKYEEPSLVVTASDVSLPALDVARANAAAGLDVDFVHSDLFERVTGAFDVILGNPPYVPSAAIAGLSPEVRREPRLALDGGPDGLALVRRIVEQAPSHLAPGGSLLLEADSRQMPAISVMMRDAGFVHISIHKDLAALDRVIEGGLPCLS